MPNRETTALVPNTVDDMLPPKSSNLVSEAAAFMRAHWPEIKPFYEVLSGEKESKHGSFELDEAACVFEVQRLAQSNGFAMLGRVKAVKLKTALRLGYKRNTGNTMKLLKQEHKQALLG